MNNGKDAKKKKKRSLPEVVSASKLLITDSTWQEAKITATHKRNKAY
jgi:hypothetical protein